MEFCSSGVVLASLGSTTLCTRAQKASPSTIWSRIPTEIIDKGLGASHGWCKIKTACTNFLLGRTKQPHQNKRKILEKPEIYSTELNNELDGNM